MKKKQEVKTIEDIVVDYTIVPNLPILYAVEIENGKHSTVLGIGNSCTHNDAVLIGIDLKSKEDGEVVIGSKDNVIRLKKDGTIMKSEILDHQRMNRPGQKFYKVLAESALRAVRLCQPLKVPPTGYDKWKEIQLNFNPTEMLRG